MPIGTCNEVYNLCKNPVTTCGFLSYILLLFCYFVLISRNWRIFFPTFILPGKTACVFGGKYWELIPKFAVPNNTKLNSEVSLFLLLGGIIFMRGSTVLWILLNRQSAGLFWTWHQILISLSSKGVLGCVYQPRFSVSMSKISISNVGSLRLFSA